MSVKGSSTCTSNAITCKFPGKILDTPCIERKQLSRVGDTSTPCEHRSQANMAYFKMPHSLTFLLILALKLILETPDKCVTRPAYPNDEQTTCALSFGSTPECQTCLIRSTPACDILYNPNILSSKDSTRTHQSHFVSNELAVSDPALTISAMAIPPWVRASVRLL